MFSPALLFVILTRDKREMLTGEVKMSYKIFYQIGLKALGCSGGSLDKRLVPVPTSLLERSGTSLLGPKAESPAKVGARRSAICISKGAHIQYRSCVLSQNLQSIVATLPFGSCWKVEY